MTQNNTPSIEAQLKQIIEKNDPYLFADLMTFSNLIIPFDEPHGTEYCHTMNARYLFVALNMHFIKYTDTQTPLEEMLFLLHSPEDLLHICDFLIEEKCFCDTLQTCLQTLQDQLEASARIKNTLISNLSNFLGHHDKS